jgi:hypothetical protein
MRRKTGDQEERTLSPGFGTGFPPRSPVVWVLVARRERGDARGGSLPESLHVSADVEALEDVIGGSREQFMRSGERETDGAGRRLLDVGAWT